jgi:hypothetical protein
MLEWEGVFARSALAKARDVESSARVDRAAKDLAKLLAKAEIASTVTHL